MKPEDLQQKASELFKLHKLEGWKFGFSRERRGLGKCYFRRKLITVSRFHCEKDSDEQVIDTLLHEIAHAIAGIDESSPDKFHGEHWQAVCRRIGANPQTLAPRGSVVRLPGTYQGVCPTCGKVFHFYRKPAMYRIRYCVACGQAKGSFVPVKVEQPRKPSMWD